MGLLDKLNNAMENNSKTIFGAYVLPNESFLFGYGTVGITDKKIMALDGWKFKFVPLNKITMVEVKIKGVLTVVAGGKEVEFNVGAQNVEKAVQVIMELIQ